MTIYRTINSMEVGFALTEQELTDAYFEKQKEFDIEDVNFVIEDEYDSFFNDRYGCSKEDVFKEAETIAQMYRERLDNSIEYTSVIYDIIYDIFSRLLG